MLSLDKSISWYLYLHVLIIVLMLKVFFLIFLVSSNLTKSSSSNNMTVTVGGTVGSLVIAAIGLLLAFVAIRCAFSQTLTNQTMNSGPFFLAITLKKIISILSYLGWTLPQISLIVFTKHCTLFFSINIDLNENQQKWQKDSHLWWKQRLLIQRNRRTTFLIHKVSKIKFMLIYITVICLFSILFIEMIIKC